MGKYVKTLLLSIAFVIVTLGLIPTQAMAKTNIEYEVIKGDTLVISATGEGDIPSQEIHYYEEDKMTKIRKIIVKEGVTGLGDYCFARYYPEVTSIELPSTVRTIGEGAFMECKSLREIQLPSGLRKIPKDCFLECSQLKKIGIPDTVTTIGKNAFRKCENMVQLIIPAQVTVWQNPIKDCPRLKKIVNYSNQQLKLDDCKGNKIWCAGGRKIKELKGKSTATSKGKKFKISYKLLGGKKAGKLPSSYTYGKAVKLPLNVQKKNYTLLGWYNPSDEDGYYCTQTSTTLSGNIVLQPIWVKYKVKNVKKQAIKIMIDDSDSVVSFGIFDIRYSQYKNMKDAKYCAQSSSSKERYIRKLKKNQRYYVQVAYTEMEDEEWGDVWVGKRSVVIKI